MKLIKRNRLPYLRTLLGRFPLYLFPSVSPLTEACLTFPGTLVVFPTTTHTHKPHPRPRTLRQEMKFRTSPFYRIYNSRPGTLSPVGGKVSVNDSYTKTITIS